MIFFPVLYFEWPSKISIQAGTASWKQTGVMFPWLKPCYDSYMILSYFYNDFSQDLAPAL